MRNRVKHFYEFGRFRLDSARRRLLKDHEPVPLPPKAAETLTVLVQNSGKVLTREELMEAIWKEVFVEDSNLTVAISQLRKVLGSGSPPTEYIETIPRIGYRFIGEVREVVDEPAPLVVEKHTLAETVIEEEYISSDTSPARDLVVVRSVKEAFSSVRPRTITMAGLIVAILVGGGIYSKLSDRRSAPFFGGANSIESLAVLPPISLNRELDDSAISLGIADALISQLGAANKLTVLPATATDRYLKPREDSIKLGHSLGVDAVIEGSLQRANGRLRVTLRLLDTRTAKQLWTGNFEEADKDIFVLEDSIAYQVVSVLHLDLNPARQKALMQRHTINSDAYNAYLKGNYLLGKRGAYAGKSIGHFRKAIELDPTFVEAYLGLANVHAFSAAWPEAEMFAQKALELDPSLAEAHATYAFIKMFRSWDWQTAGREFDWALELNPNSANAHHWKGVYLSILGKLDDAKAEMHTALKLDPMSLVIMADIGQLHYFAHEYDKCVELCTNILQIDKDFENAHLYLAFAYLILGKEREAFEHFVSGGNLPSDEEERQRRIFETSGFKGLMQFQLSRSRNPGNPSSDINAWSLIDLYNGLGDRQNTLQALERSFDEHSFLLPFINVDPRFDYLRQDPRFETIIKGMGL